MIGVLASVVGLFLGLVLAKGLNALFKSFGIDLPTNGTVFATRTVVVSLAIGIIVTLLASLRPAIRATRVPPIAAVREGSVLPQSRFARFGPFAAPLPCCDRDRRSPARRLRCRRPGRKPAAAAARHRRPAGLHRRGDLRAARRQAADPLSSDRSEPGRWPRSRSSSTRSCSCSGCSRHGSCAGRAGTARCPTGS